MPSAATTRSRLAMLPVGTKVRVKLEDGTELIGIYRGLDGEELQLGDADAPEAEDVVTAALELGKVETVLMDVSTEGPE